MQSSLAFACLCWIGVTSIPRAGEGPHVVKLNGPLVHEIDGDVSSAKLSPDGSRVVYRANPSTTGTELFSVPSDGSGPAVQLSDHSTTYAGSFLISPDSAWVVYLELQQALQLWSVPIDGSLPPLRLTGIVGTIESFAIAPDSSRVVFQALFSGKHRLLSAPIHTAASVVTLNDLDAGGTGVQQYEISPDSSRVAYRATTATSGSQLWSVAIDHAPPVMLGPPLPWGRNVEDFEFVPDGSLVLYRARQDSFTIEPYVVPVGGGAAVKLADQTQDVTVAHASPDGTGVVYYAGGLFRVPIAGGTPVQLGTFPVVATASFLVSPDSARVAFLSPGGGLYAVPITGGPLRHLSTGIQQFEFSPDGAHVLYRAADAVFSVPVPAGAAAQLSPPATQAGAFLVDASSGRVVFPVSGGQGGPWSAPIDGSQPAISLAPGDAFVSASVGAGQAIYVSESGLNLASSADDVFELYRVPLDGSEASVRINAPFVPGPVVLGDVSSFLVSPRRGSVVYVADQDADQHLASFIVPGGGGAPEEIGPAAANRNMVAKAIAPDGSFAIIHGSVGAEGYDVFRAALDGSHALLALTGPSTLADSVDEPVLLDPTGTHVVYLSQGQLWSVRSDGSAAPSLLSPPQHPGAQGLVLSADGARAVWTSGALYSALLDGSQPAVQLNFYAKHFALSPDSTRVVFTGGGFVGVGDLYSVPIDGSEAPRRISFPPDGGKVLAAGFAAENEFQIAPDSRRVVYIAGFTGPVVKFELYAVSIEGGPSVRLNGRLASGGNVLVSHSFDEYNNFAANGEFRISPDCRHVVYKADQRLASRVETFSAPLPRFFDHARLTEPPKSVRLTGFSSPGSGFEITRDGTAVVCVGSFRGRSGLLRVPIEGGTPVELCPRSGREFRFAPDGASVLYLTDLESPGRFELFDLALDLSRPTLRVSGPLVSGGDVQPGFRFGAGGRVFYLADQDVDEVIELYGTVPQLEGHVKPR